MSKVTATTTKNLSRNLVTFPIDTNQSLFNCSPLFKNYHIFVGILGGNLPNKSK